MQVFLNNRRNLHEPFSWDTPALAPKRTCGILFLKERILFLGPGFSPGSVIYQYETVSIYLPSLSFPSIKWEYCCSQRVLMWLKCGHIKRPYSIVVSS